MKTIQSKTGQIFTLLLALAVLVCATTNVQAGTTYTATNTTANTPWATTTTWSPNGTPGASDFAIIPNGISVRIPNSDNNRTCGAIDIKSGGSLVIGSGSGVVTGVTLGDILIESGGTLNGATGNGQSWTFSGNVTNFGSMTVSGNNSTAYTYSGVNKSLVGNITNVQAIVTGTYTNLGNFVTGSGQQITGLSGSGTFNNFGVIYYGGNAASTVSTLIVTNVGNAYVTVANSGQQGAVQTATYFNLQTGAPGGSAPVSNITNILYNLTIQNGGNFLTYPTAFLNFVGTLFYADDSGGTIASTFTMGGNVGIGGNNATITYSGVFGDGGNAYSLSKISTDTINLKPAAVETYTGNTIVNGGTLFLDYSGFSGAQNNLINSNSGLVFGGTNLGINGLGGGTLTVSGKGSSTDAQTFNGLTLLAGGSTVNDVLVGTKTTINLGAIAARSAGGGTVDFTASGTTTSTPITTTTANNSAGILGGWATVTGSSDWAAESGSTPFVISALAAYTGALPASGGAVTDNDTNNAGIALTGPVSANSLKLTSANTLALAGNNLTLAGGASGASGGLLATASASITTSGGVVTAGSGNELIINTKSGATLSTPGSALIGANNGSLTKSGAGGLTFSSSASYTGPTVVNQGTLTLSAGTLASSSIIVDAGATLTIPPTTFTSQDLAGSGTINGALATMGSGGTIHPGGNGVYGTLAFGAGLTLGSSSTITYDLDAQQSVRDDQIAVTGILTCGSANIVINPGVNFRPGTYTLVTCTNISGTFNPTVTFASGSGTVTLSYTATGVILTVSSFAACATPAAYGVTGGTGCSSSGVTVGLANSDAGTTYQLFTNGVSAGASALIVSVGGATNFGNQTVVGTYTVWATNACGNSALMNGSAVVSQAPTTTYNMSGGSTGCSGAGNGLTIGLSSSDSGVSYQLVLTNATVTNIVATVPGTNGLAISFGSQTTAGTYYVQGTNAGCGIVAINGGTTNSIVINPTPGAPSPSAMAGDGQVTVSWTAPAGTVTSYNVYRGTSGSGSETLFTNVSGSPFVDNSVADGSQYFYKVTALNGTCEGAPSAEVGATPNPPYTAYIITDAGGGTTMAGASDVLTITAVSNASPASIGGPISIIFSGLSNSPSGTSPTMGGTAFSGGSVTNTVNFTNGVGNITLVAYNAGTGKTLIATDGTHATSGGGGSPLGLTVTPTSSSAYRLTGTGNPQVAVNYPVNVALVDQYQNVETGTNASLNMTFNSSLSAGADGSVATINNTNQNVAASVTLVNGTNSVPLVAHTNDVAGKVITVTDGTFTSAGTGGTTLTLGAVAQGAANKLSMKTQPSSTATVGVAFGTQPAVNVLDVYSNILTSSTATISASASGGFILQGTTNVTANGSLGYVTYSGLSLTNVGSITLTFSSGVLTPVSSTAISVGGGTVTQVIWATQPGNANSGVAFSPQPVMETADQFGNPSTNGLQSGLPVTIVITNGTGTLIGTTNYNLGTAFSNGVATTTGLGVTGSGSYQLAIIVSGIYGKPVSGMAIWLDANNPPSVSLSGANVTAWNDLSGNGYNFSTIQGTGNPTYTNSTIVGETALKVVSFNVNEVKNTSFNYTGAGATNISTFIVFRQITPVNYANMHGTYNGSANDYQSYQSYCLDLGGSANTARLIRYEGGSCNGDIAVGANSNYYTNQYYYASMIMNYGTNEIWVNGGTGATGGCNGNGFSIVGTSVGDGLNGSGGIRGSAGQQDEIGEFLIYTNDMTSQRATIETYLNKKWQGGATNTAVVSTSFSIANVVTPVFTGLSSVTNTYGTASIVLTGTCKSGTNYPGAGDAISATINGFTVSGSFNDGTSGNFTINYNDASLATNSVGNSPYTITYIYGGNGSTLNPATNNATALTINQAVPTATLAVNNSPVTYNASGQAATVSVTSSNTPGAVANTLTGGATTQTASGTYAVTANYVPTDNIDYMTLSNLPAGSFTINQATSTATLAVNNPTVTYNGSGQSASVGITASNTPGTVGSVQYNGSATLPTNVNTYAVTASFVPTDTNYTTLTGLSAGSFTITPATPVLSVSNTPVFYNGLGQSAAVTSSVPGVVTNIVTGGQASQTNAGTYSVAADFIPTDTTDYISLTNASAGNFVIQPAVPVLAVSNSPVPYNGSAYSAVVTSSVPGTVSGVLMAGQPSQTSAGTYAVTANFAPVDSVNYASLTNAPAGSFVIQQATPSVTFYLGTPGSTNVTVTYDASGHSAVSSIILWSDSPGGSYNTVLTGGAASQTNVGIYTVTLNWVPNDPNYLTLTGLAVGTYTIQPATTVITAAPTASAITNGQTLASSMLTGGSATPSGGTFAFTTPSTAPPVGTNSESVTYTYSDTNYATATTNVSVIVYSSAGCTGPAIVGGIAGTTNLCVGSPLMLTLTNVTGDAPLSYQWQTNNVAIASGTNSAYTNLSVAVPDSGNYVCVVTNACGAITSAVATVTVNPPPTVSVNSVTNCGTVSTILTATSSASSPLYSWSDGETTASITNASPAVTTNYTVTVTDGVTGCANSGGGGIVVNPLPTVSVNSVTNYGVMPATLTATTSAGSPIYLWSPGGATTPSITTSPTVTTNYTVTVTDGVTGCANSANGTITVYSVPTLSITGSGANVVVKWTNTAVGFNLEMATNLALPQVWGTNLTVPVVIGGQYTVTNPASGPVLFYRLSH